MRPTPRGLGTDERHWSDGTRSRSAEIRLFLDGKRVVADRPPFPAGSVFGDGDRRRACGSHATIESRRRNTAALRGRSRTAAARPYRPKANWQNRTERRTDQNHHQITFHTQEAWNTDLTFTHTKPGQIGFEDIFRSELWREFDAICRLWRALQRHSGCHSGD